MGWDFYEVLFWGGGLGEGDGEGFVADFLGVAGDDCGEGFIVGGEC